MQTRGYTNNLKSWQMGCIKAPWFRDRKKHCICLALLFLLILHSCSSPSKANPTYFTQNVMTIDYHVAIGDRLSHHKKELVQKIINATFQEINDIYNKWNPHSELSQLNALSADTPYILSPQLYRFLQRIDTLVHLSQGRFDPTIEPLQQLWKTKLEQGSCPTQQEIETIKPCIGWHTIHFKNGLFYKENASTQLDLGGVAKGFCVDLLIERLHLAGLHHLYVEWGGEIRTLGLHPSKRPWRVCISHLANLDPSQAIAQVDLINRALATSGDYYQYWKVTTDKGEEKTYCHVFNPLTLAPVEVKPGSVASASLLASDCMTADALAKVLMLFDSIEEAQTWVKNLQIQFPEIACWIAAR